MWVRCLIVWCVVAVCWRCVLCSKLGRVMFFKVPFAAVPDLVMRRQVLLRDGYAYVREAQVCHGRDDVLRTRGTGTCMPKHDADATHTGLCQSQASVSSSFTMCLVSCVCVYRLVPWWLAASACTCLLP
jgi:hypothetical protein